ncbi:MAG: type II secretion system F family protein, partial [Oscillospiraceae bacterium]
TQLGSQMSPFSQSIMRLGTAVGRYSYIIVIFAAVLVGLFYLLKSTYAGRNLISRFQSSFFVTRKLSQKIASGRFAAAMSLMLSSGLETEEALNMTESLVDNVYIRDKITLCKSNIADGLSFSEALAKSGIFTGVYTQMVVVGFKTGSVDTVMRKLADRYEEETDAQINSMISVLEPTLVAALSIVVGMILLSVMLPLMGIMSSIG